MHRAALFIFHRDLRLVDNTALLAALKESQQVIAAFIFDPRQLEKHAYKSAPGAAFLMESLKELAQEIEEKGGRLHIFLGKTEDVVKEIIDKQQVQALYWNRDYTPFAQKRDAKLKQIAKKQGIEVKECDDALLCPPEAVHKPDGSPYTVYTPFYKRAAAETVVPLPKRNPHTNYLRKKLPGTTSLKEVEKQYDFSGAAQQRLLGGREEGKKLLRALVKKTAYTKQRDLPAVSGTSLLSAHHKFGTISIRETYHKAASIFGKESQYIKELYWRDFFTHIALHFPHVFTGAFRSMYDALRWNTSKQDFTRWCEGKTGYPIVDAGMRELNETGYMHNRVRMIVASFLVKDLQINWQWGEKYFAQKLTDYDPSVNNGSWQWAASTGCDAQPYFRIFNPWTQQKKFDPDAAYIKRWVAELKDLSAKEIHSIEKGGVVEGYPNPMVEHAEARKKTLEMFGEVRK